MRKEIIFVIEKLFNDEPFIKVFDEDMTLNDKLQLLTSESLLALMLVTTLEDEFELEFEDDEIDLIFFSNIDVLVNKTINAYKKTHKAKT